MKLVFLGPPGAGKGTQAKLLAKKYNLAHISTGDMFRAAIASGSELGNRVKAILDAGHLVSDDMTVEVVRDRLAQADCQPGYILDGFPRTIPQAEALERLLAETGCALTSVVLFEVNENLLQQRLDGRRAAQGRTDDDPEAQLERMRVYQRQTAPLIDFYEKKNLLKRISGSGKIEDVSKRLESALA
jgi:adenylate kinase